MAAGRIVLVVLERSCVLRLLASLILNDRSACSPPNSPRRAGFLRPVLSSTPRSAKALCGIAWSISLSAMLANAGRWVGQQGTILQFNNLA
jgi:hypothetical protein